MTSWDELGAGEAYEVSLVATMDTERFVDSPRRQRAQLAVDTVAAKLQACEGVEVIDAALVSEAEISLADERLLRRFDFDYLSADNEEAEPSRG